MENKKTEKTLSEFLKLPKDIQLHSIMFSETGVKELDKMQQVLMELDATLETFFEKQQFQNLINQLTIRPF